MTLAIVCDRWDRRGGGCEQYLSNLLSHTTVSGIETRVYAPRIRKPAPANVRKISRLGRLGVLSNRYCDNNSARGPALSGKTILALRPFPGATHYQIHTGLYASTFKAERESLPSPLRRLLYPAANRLNINRQRLLGLQKNWLTGPQKPSIMVFSHLTALELKRSFRIPLEKIAVVPHGVDPEKFHPRAGAPSGTSTLNRPRGSGKRALLLFAGHNFFLKGLHCLLEAMGRLRKSGDEFTLTVAGAGPIPYFRRLAEKHKIGSQVTFLGRVSQDDLVRLYRESAALVHPTFYDPCSLVTLEALACGCPVVTTKRNGASELFESGREGFILDDPRDTDALAGLLCRFRDPHTTKQMGHAASELAPGLDLNRHMLQVTQWLGLSGETGSSRNP